MALGDFAAVAVRSTVGGFYFPRTPLIQNGVIFSSAAGLFNFFATVSHSPTLFEETSDCGVVDIMEH